MMYNFRQIDVSIYIHSSFERLMVVFALISDKKLSIRKLVSVTTLGFFCLGCHMCLLLVLSHLVPVAH